MRKYSRAEGKRENHVKTNPAREGLQEKYTAGERYKDFLMNSKKLEYA